MDQGEEFSEKIAKKAPNSPLSIKSSFLGFTSPTGIHSRKRDHGTGNFRSESNRRLSEVLSEGNINKNVLVSRQKTRDLHHVCGNGGAGGKFMLIANSCNYRASRAADIGTEKPRRKY